jgi:hypothetical protein
MAASHYFRIFIFLYFFPLFNLVYVSVLLCLLTPVVLHKVDRRFWVKEIPNKAKVLYEL